MKPISYPLERKMKRSKRVTIFEIIVLGLLLIIIAVFAYGVYVGGSMGKNLGI